MTRYTCDCGLPVDEDNGFCRVCQSTEDAPVEKVLDLMAALKRSLAQPATTPESSTAKSAVDVAVPSQEGAPATEKSVSGGDR